MCPVTPCLCCRVKTLSLVVSGGCHEGRVAPLARDPTTGSTMHVPGPAELPALLASCTLCYSQHLVSLRLATIRVSAAPGPHTLTITLSEVS